MPSDDRRIDLLLQRLEQLAEEFRQIEAESGAAREAAIAKSGLDPDLVRRMLAAGAVDSSLTSRDQYDQSQGMPQANSTNVFQQPVGKPLKSKGPIAKHARRLGLTMTELAEKVGADHWNLRNWDKRDSVPEEIRKRLEAIPTPAKPGKRAK